MFIELTECTGNDKRGFIGKIHLRKDHIESITDSDKWIVEEARYWLVVSMVSGDSYIVEESIEKIFSLYERE
jgi:uncharacterized protein YlzI (FlbEa/FlbD family)